MASRIVKMGVMIVIVCIILGATYLILNSEKRENIQNKNLLVARTYVDGFFLNDYGCIKVIFSDYTMYYIEFKGNVNDNYTSDSIILSGDNNNLTAKEVRDIITLVDEVNEISFDKIFEHGYELIYSDKFHLTSMEFDDLNTTINKSNFLSLNESYSDDGPYIITEQTGIRLTVHLNNTNKTVTDYNNNAPENYQSIENMVNELFLARGVEDETVLHK